MPRVVVGPRAEREVEQAARWYARQRAGLGDEFVDAVAATLARLADGPERYSVVYRDLRRVPVDRFPYALTFRLLGDAARVVACTHHRRDPRRWQTRR